MSPWGYSRASGVASGFDRATKIHLSGTGFGVLVGALGGKSSCMPNFSRHVASLPGRPRFPIWDFEPASV